MHFSKQQMHTKLHTRQIRHIITIEFEHGHVFPFGQPISCLHTLTLHFHLAAQFKCKVVGLVGRGDQIMCGAANVDFECYKTLWMIRKDKKTYVTRCFPSDWPC
jgi:hypothetical protein